jgi:hypothetical protein
MLLRVLQSSTARGSFAGTGTPAPLVHTSYRVEAAAGGDIGEQTEDVAFNIKITALDQNGDTFTSFVGTANITSDGSLSAGGGATAAFTAGVLASHSVTFSTGWESTEITATTGGVTGISNSFQVLVVSADHPNEPAGMTQTDDRGFDALDEEGWNDENNISIISDASAPLTPNNVGQILYPAGGTGGGVSFGRAWRGTGSHKIKYVDTWVKFSSNFQNHPSGVNKMHHFFVGGLNRLLTLAKGQNLIAMFGLQQIAEAYNPGYGTPGTSLHLIPNLVAESLAYLTRNQWHRLIMVMTANTSGQADGRVEMWVAQNEGTLLKTHDYSGIKFTTGAPTFNEMHWSPTWGGVSGTTVSAEMYFWCDHLYISGKN